MPNNKMAMTISLLAMWFSALSGCGPGEAPDALAQGGSGLAFVEPRTRTIELSKNEAQQLEIMNGGILDENIAGGYIVLAPGNEMTGAEKDTYKKALLRRPLEMAQEGGRPGDVNVSWCSGWYLSNVQYRGGSWYFPSLRLGAAEGWGPITLTVNVTRTVSATFSANVGVSAEVVSAGVGFDVNASFSVSTEGSWNVPSGVHGRLEAYALFDKYTFDVWDDDCGDPADTYKGNGAAYKPNLGIYFKKVYL